MLTDDGNPQQTILLREAGPPGSPTVTPLNFGSIGVFEFLAADGGYYAYDYRGTKTEE